MNKPLQIALRGSISFVMLAAVLTGCSKERDRHNHPGLTTGKALFDFHCAECHGHDGTGRLVDRTPANILTTKDLEGIEDYITNATGQGRKMPVFANMPRPEARQIAAYLLELRQRYDALPANKRKNRQLMIDPARETGTQPSSGDGFDDPR